MDKIKAQVPSYNHKYYIGIRSSDRKFDSGYFESDITIFSEQTGPTRFPIRPNQNKTNKYIIPYMVECIDRLLSQFSNCYFMFYNNMMAYNFPSRLRRHFLCLNARELIQSLNDKADMKRWLSDCDIPILSYETFLGQDITIEALKLRFPHTNCYVIQSNHGGGGVGTFVVTTSNFDSVRARFQPLKLYLISAYEKFSVSVNTHIFVSEKQTVLSPGSIQIVEMEQDQLCYRGADFATFRKLPKECREQVRNFSLKIANQLRSRGYRGIAGLDFLVTRDRGVYCMEINPRFQASSLPLDLYLRKELNEQYVAHSVFELNEQAFNNQMVTSLCFDDVINYSLYYYYKGSLPLKYFLYKREQLIAEQAIVQDDGLLNFAEESRLDEDSYLFRAVFSHPICSISPDMTLWLNDSIPVREAPTDLLDLKIALLNQGVRPSNDGKQIKKGVYESIDLTYQGKLSRNRPVAINCAYGINLSQYSPYTLNLDTAVSEITYYGQSLGNVDVEVDLLAGLSHLDRRILYLATDRLRIKLVAGCEYKNIGQGCQFCNLPMSDKRFTRKELRDALTHLKNITLSFRHILIGGGTCLSQDAWEDVIWLCKYLKADKDYQDKPISLMTILPPKEMLSAFQAAGLEEVAFNIEISDDDIGQKIMPGKRGQPKCAYYSTLAKAVEIFGVGSVRSALLVGVDREDQVVKEVKHLAQMGVIPCLSALRALPGSEFSDMIHPDNRSLRRVYDRCSKLLAEMNGQVTELGPKCSVCKNNMLAL